MASDSSREKRKLAWRTKFAETVENRENCRLVKGILKKDPSDRSTRDLEILEELEVLVCQVEDRARKQARAKTKLDEVLDPTDVLESKVNLLVQAIKEAETLAVYTGAGISTAARIPDYRGPNGIWTRLAKGEQLGSYNLVDAEPTLSHMSITKLHHEGLVRHVVSQNCDGLHIRSGLPREALSEVHGNMFAEVCTECNKERLYFRLFDVTERTALRRHQTGRNCCECDGPLRDTIVHFGEKGNLDQPLNWQGAFDVAKVADCILCLGSSLKVLKRYHALWGMNRVKHRRPKLFIVNLQWTPKDEHANVKLNARCDEVMKMVMDKLGLEIPEYQRENDPLFSLATPLQPHELESHTTKSLTHPASESSDFQPTELKRTLSSPVPIKTEAENEHANGHNVEQEDLKRTGEHESSELVGSAPGPGWYGKGYGKTKRPAKRRRTR